MRQLIVTIMAGGMGKRMMSNVPKALHKVNDLPMIVRIINAVLPLTPHKIIVVVAPSVHEMIADAVKSAVPEVVYNKVGFVVQPTAQGTGHAIQCTLPLFDGVDDSAVNLILCGDTPLLQSNELVAMYASFRSELQVTGIHLDNPHGYGRILMNGKSFERIVEENDCTDGQKLLNLVNCSIYFVAVGILKRFVPTIKNINSKNEYYLTDLVEIAHNAGHNISVSVMDASLSDHIMNVNTPEQLQTANQLAVWSD